MNKLMALWLGLAVFVLAACGGEQTAENESTDKAPVERIPVEVADARLGSISAYYAATATLEADGQARVVPRMAGQVVELLVEEGDFLKAGDVMARIDDERLRLELTRAEADLSRLQQDFNRHREMHQRSMISTEAFERLKFEFDAQKAQHDLVKLELSYTNITAPINGVVSERMIRVGNMVNTVDPIFVLTALDPLRAVLHVPESELSRLLRGQSAVLRADALPGEEFLGEVARISPVIDAESGTFRVTIELSDASGRLRPGMFGRFSIVYDQRDNVVMVPVDSVLTEDGRSAVFVISDGEAERRPVIPGYRNNGDYEIIEGLAVGERVVVTGQASLRSGSPVLVLGDPTGLADSSVVASATLVESLLDDET